MLGKYLDRRRENREKMRDAEARLRTEEKLNTEKGDHFAMFLAALKVFGPYILGLIGILLGAYWLFVGRF